MVSYRYWRAIKTTGQFSGLDLHSLEDFGVPWKRFHDLNPSYFVARLDVRRHCVIPSGCESVGLVDAQKRRRRTSYID